MAKSLYSKVKLELSKVYAFRSYTTKYNNLLKLKSDAEDFGDVTLVAYIDNMLPYVSRISSYAERKLYQNCRDEHRIVAIYSQQAIVYCDSVLSSQEPEWAVMARKNGWRPG